jgi:hypothetical protein
VTTPSAEEPRQDEDTTGGDVNADRSQDSDADPAMMDTATRRNEASAEGAG